MEKDGEGTVGEREKGGSEQTAHGRRKGGEHPCERWRAGASGSRKRESWGSWSAVCCCVRGSHRRQQFIADLFGLTEGFILPLSLCLSLSVCLSHLSHSQKLWITPGITSSPVFSKAHSVAQCCACAKEYKTHLFCFKRNNLCVSFVNRCLCWHKECVQKHICCRALWFYCQQSWMIECARRKQWLLYYYFIIFVICFFLLKVRHFTPLILKSLCSWVQSILLPLSDFLPT